MRGGLVNIVLWILQIMLAIAFAFSGVTKLSQPKEKLRANMAWVDDHSDRTIKLIGAAEVLAALGLVLPAWTGIAPILTPLAATGLIIIMIGAMITHARRKEPQGIATAATLFVLAAVVAWGRFGPYSF